MLYLVRHGETDWNAQGKWQGHSDISLNDQGRIQAREAATYFAEKNIDIAYSSDLNRARETAKIIVKGKNIPILSEPYLRERSFGPLEGKTTTEIGNILGRKISIMQIVSEDIPIEGVETVSGQFYRAEAFLNKLKGKEGFDKLVVSHGVLIGILLQLIVGVDFKTRKVGNCEIISLPDY